MVRLAADVVRQSAPTSAGNMDFVWSHNDEPKLAIVTATLDDTDGTAVAHGSWSRGFTDGTKQFAIGTRSQDAVNPTNVDGIGKNDRVLYVIASGSDAAALEASFVQWLAAPGGVRLNFATVGAVGYKVTVELYGGDALHALVGNAATLGVIGGMSTISPGFDPVYIECMTRFAALSGAFAADPVISYGFATPSAQQCIAFGDKNAVTPSQAYAYRDAARLLRKITTAATGVSVEATWPLPDRITLVTRDVAESVTLAYAVIGIDAGGGRIALYGFDTPTATPSNNFDDLGAGWKPQLVKYLMNQATATGALITTGPAGSVGWAAIAAAAQGCHSVQFQDNVAAANTQSLTNSTAVDFAFHGGGASHAATFDSFQPTGLRLDWSAADVTAKKWIGVAVEQSVIEGTANGVSGQCSGSTAGTVVTPGTANGVSGQCSGLASGTVITPGTANATSGQCSGSIEGTTGARTGTAFAQSGPCSGFMFSLQPHVVIGERRGYARGPQVVGAARGPQVRGYAA